MDPKSATQYVLGKYDDEGYVMRLIPIDEENRVFYQKFEKEGNLTSYMSRIYPNNESSYLKWMYIEEDEHYIGSIWLEGKDIYWIKLGIFIAEPLYRNKGLGKKAIQQMLAIAKSDGIRIVTLNVRLENERAIKVYTDCVFKIKARFKKENGIDVFSMELQMYY